MASKNRRQAAPIAMLDKLKESPESYKLFDTLRLLERRYKDSSRLGRSSKPCQDPVKIGQDVSLAFAHANISKFDYDEKQASLLNTAYGIFGPNGAQPLIVSEYAFERKNTYGDDTFLRFSDIFHHRSISLLYRAWANTQPTIELDRVDDNLFDDYLSALSGCLSPKNSNNSNDFSHQNERFFHAGLFKQETRSSDGLKILLSDVFQVPVDIKSITGGWLALEKKHQFNLSFSTQLGVNSYLGENVYSCQYKFSINMGVINYKKFVHLLPHTDGYKNLFNLVSEYVGIEFEWDLIFFVDKETLPKWRLGQESALGWNLWLGDSAVEEGDAFVMIEDKNNSEKARSSEIRFSDRSAAMYEFC